jgi:NTE family protein
MKKHAIFLLLSIFSTLFTHVSATDEPKTLPPQTRPKIGLVLGGGGARGLAHIGVLKVLKEARIPIDCIVGTSMGSLVGGAVAAGRTPEEAEELVLKHNWVATLSGTASRDKLAYRQKQNDRLGMAQFEIGISDDQEILIPKSAISTQKVALFLRNATMGAAPRSFDELTIPYRAIAANIEDGSMVVLDKGDLVTAMSASMAVPGVFPPVNVKGKILVDGGIARNLPVDVARKLCADVVIVVNVGMEPLRREKIGGIFTMADQLVRILIAKNVQPQLQSLTEQDVLIEPQLEDLGAIEFSRSEEFIMRGEEAARRQLASLKRYSVSEAEYQAWQEARYKRRPQPQKIDEVTVQVTESSKVNPAVLKERLGVKPGDMLRTKEFAAKLENVYASTDLEQLGYELLYTNKDTQLNILPVEKSWGPNYLSFGLGLRTDLNGASNFTLSALYRRTWINSLGAEWKTLFQLGELRQIYSEFYQPLIEDAWIYVAPYAAFYSRPLDVYLKHGVFTKPYANRASIGADVGSSVSRFGEVRIGLNANYYREAIDGFQKEFSPHATHKDIGVQANLYYDQLDRLYFPSSGSALHLSGYQSLKGIGNNGVEYRKGAIQAATAFRLGKVHTMWSIDAAYVSDKAPLSEYSLLGGLFNLSGYQYKELLGQGKALAKVQIYYPVSFLAELSDRAHYVGVSLEAGRIFDTVSPYLKQHGKYSYSLYWATDTPLGPFYVACARGDNRQNRFYLVLGTNF